MTKSRAPGVGRKGEGKLCRERKGELRKSRGVGERGNGMEGGRRAGRKAVAFRTHCNLFKHTLPHIVPSEIFGKSEKSNCAYGVRNSALLL